MSDFPEQRAPNAPAVQIPISAIRSNNTLAICGTIVLLACIAATVYLSNAQTNDLAASGIITTIVLSVLASTFGVVKLNRIEKKVDQAVEQTNGALDARIEKTIRRVLKDSLLE